MSSQRLSGPKRQPSMASTASSAAGTSSNAAPSTASPSAFPSSSPAQRLRRLIWDATIPIVVTVESEDLPQGPLDRSIEAHYLKAARISYLPLVLQEVKSSLLAMMMDDATLKAIKEEDFWFTYEGTPLRWHWPIGLLFDYHTANTSPTLHRSNATPSTSVQRRSSMTPIDSAAPSTDPASQPSLERPLLPWRLTLRIGNAPLEKLHSAPGLDNCRTSFMSMLKEADFVRWGSTKRVTNLRKAEQDALWEGVMSHNFDTYWSVASKIIPSMPAATEGAGGSGTMSGFSSRAPSVSLPPLNGEQGRSGALTQQVNESQTSLHSAAPSESGTSVAESTATTGGRNNSQYRSLPMRFHLLQGAPVVQEPVPPYSEDGRPTTLHSVLSALFPLLVPPTPTFSTSSTLHSSPPPPMAYAVIQGIRVPFEAEIPWIGAALASADGWVSVCIHLLAEGERM